MGILKKISLKTPRRVKDRELGGYKYKKGITHSRARLKHTRPKARKVVK